MPTDDIRAPGHVVFAGPGRDLPHAVEVAVESPGLADRRQLPRIPGLEPEPEPAVRRPEQANILVLDKIHANQQPVLLDGYIQSRKPGQELAPPRLAHPEQRIPEVQRPPAQIQKLVQPRDLLERSLDRQRPP